MNMYLARNESFFTQNFPSPFAILPKLNQLTHNFSFLQFFLVVFLALFLLVCHYLNVFCDSNRVHRHVHSQLNWRDTLHLRQFVCYAFCGDRKLNFAVNLLGVAARLQGHTDPAYKSAQLVIIRCEGSVSPLSTVHRNNLLLDRF